MVTTPWEFNLNSLILREDRTIFSNNARILFFVNFHLFVNTSFEFSAVSLKANFIFQFYDIFKKIGKYSHLLKEILHHSSFDK